MKVMDRFARWQTIARTLSCVAVLLYCAVASAQINPGDPGWYARIVNASGTIDSHTKAENVLGGEFGIIDIGVGVVDVVDFAGGGGTFGVNNPYPNGVGDESMDDFVVQVWSEVTIPAGEWGIGFGTDDGGQVTIPGVTFLDRFNQNGTPAGDDQIRFEGNRGHAWTFGAFELTAPLTTTIHASMHERGGGDTFEVAVTDFLPFDSDTPNDLDWFLLGDPESIAFDQKFDWGFKVPDPVPSAVLNIAGPGGTGSQLVSGALTDTVIEDLAGIQPGLLHYWYGRGNPGSYDGVTAFYDFNDDPKAIEDPDIPPFNPASTWWTGNQAAITGGTTSAPKYPVEVIGQPRVDGGTFNDSNNDNYTTILSGQIKIPENGAYTFTDGIDDLTVLGIDVNRDGFIDDVDEFFINDNAWTSVNRDANGGGFTTNGGEYIVAEFSGIDPANEDTQWFDIELIAAEGGGDDAGVVYWDYDVNDRDGDGQKLGDAQGFPDPTGNTDRAIIDGRVIANEDLSELLIPEDNLRGPGGEALTAGNINASLNSSVEYIFEINEDGTFDAIEVSRPFDAAVTKLDLNDATINLAAIGDVSGLSGEFRLLSADELSGNATLVVPAGLEGIIDSSNFLTTGIIIVGGATGIPGDIDGDGTVAFADFLILSANFGQMANLAGGDIDGDGTVGFPDFLILSANFGRSAGATAAVPEPSSLALLGFGGLLIGLLRRRRR